MLYSLCLAKRIRQTLLNFRFSDLLFQPLSSVEGAYLQNNNNIISFLTTDLSPHWLNLYSRGVQYV